MKELTNITILKNLKTGKEADVFLVLKKGQLFALKKYRPDALKSTNADYIAGKHFKEKSIRKAVSKRTKVGKEIIRKIWTRREFYMLKKFYELGANVPQVFEFTDDAILMELIGNEYEVAQRLKNVKLTKEQQQKVFEEIKKSIKIFFQNGIVHGDLSEFNILWWKDKSYIIDFPQAIDIRKNPNFDVILRRDIQNIVKFFKDLNINIENLYGEITKEQSFN